MNADFPKTAGSPCFADLEEGKAYSWCSCGLSTSMPFCDGSHEGTGIEPLNFVARKTETALLCGCAQTGDPPYCDGTHDVI